MGSNNIAFAVVALTIATIVFACVGAYGIAWAVSAGWHAGACS